MSLLQLARGKDERNTVPTTHLELLCYRMFFSGHSSAAYAKATHTPSSYKTPAVLLIYTVKSGKGFGSDRGKKTST
jgi:hypothetical protein